MTTIRRVGPPLSHIPIRHTCGDFEARLTRWNVFDPTVAVDVPNDAGYLIAGSVCSKCKPQGRPVQSCFSSLSDVQLFCACKNDPTHNLTGEVVWIVLETADIDLIGAATFSTKLVATEHFEALARENSVSDVENTLLDREARGTLRFAGDDAYAVQLVEQFIDQAPHRSTPRPVPPTLDESYIAVHRRVRLAQTILAVTHDYGEYRSNERAYAWLTAWLHRHGYDTERLRRLTSSAAYAALASEPAYERLARRFTHPAAQGANR